MIEPIAHRQAVGRGVLASLLAMLLISLGSAAAWAVTAGGASPDTAVSLPIDGLNGSFVASNEHMDARYGWISDALPIGQQGVYPLPYWDNVAWYSVTPSATTQVFIWAESISPDGWLDTLEVWTAAGELVMDAYGPDAYLTAVLVAGTTYHIGLGGMDALDRGTAELTFTTLVPSVPRSVTGVPGDASATVSWEAPVELAGGVFDYVLLCEPDCGTAGNYVTLRGTPPATSIEIGGLTNGTAYTFRVAAVNPLGSSLLTARSAPVTPKAVPVVEVSTVPAQPRTGEPFDVVATVTVGGAPADGAVDLTVAGATTSGLALVGGQARIAGLVRPAGPVALSAAYAGSATVLPGTGSLAATVAKRPQSVTFTAVPAGQVYDGSAVPLVASASTGLPVTFDATGACTLTAGSVDLTGVGTCTVTATQVGDSQTLAASTSQAFEVGKRSQTIALDALPGLVYAQEPVTLAPTSSAGLPVTLAATGACTLTGSVLAATGVGPCEVTARQAGDGLTLPATAVVRSTAVAKRPQSVTLTQLPELTFGLAPITIVASSEFDLPVTLTAGGACSFVEGQLTIVGVGLCTVTASAEGDAQTLPGTATTSGDVRGVPTDVEVDLDADLGARAAGATVSAAGTGLLPGSELVLEVHSTPQVIGRVTVGADGRAVVSGVLSALEAGDHEIVALGTALDGTPGEHVLGFAVDAAGTLVRIGTATLPADEVVAVTLARTGADVADARALAALMLVTGVGLVLLRRRLDPREPARVATR